MSDHKSPGVACSCLHVRHDLDTRESDCFTFDRPGEASLAALFASALGSDIRADGIAESALLRLHNELSVFADYVASAETLLSEEILADVLHGMADRARVAAEVSERIATARALQVERSAES
ncbi:MAG TPA: hypothetical protein VFR23_26100 [Jiangellaceae bacterium]|nr:hypothetical protein [Jiangellaceae bacterium]